LTHILVGGVKRSGTTLLYGTLCSGNQTNPALFETHLISHLLAAYSHARYRSNHVDSGQFFGDADTLQNLFRKPLKEFLDLVRARHGSPQHLVLKSTTLTPYAADALDLIADCKVIVGVRDPRDIVASQLEVDIKERRIAPGQHTQAHIERLASDVMRAYEKCLRALPRVSDRLHFVRYEDLVLSPREVVEKLSEWTGLDLSDFDPQNAWARSLRDFAADRAAGSAYVTDLFGKGISDRRIGQHRRLLHAADVHTVETACRLLMRAFQYPFKEIAAS